MSKQKNKTPEEQQGIEEARKELALIEGIQLALNPIIEQVADRLIAYGAYEPPNARPDELGAPPDARGVLMLGRLGLTQEAAELWDALESLHKADEALSNAAMRIERRSLGEPRNFSLKEQVEAIFRSLRGYWP